MHASARRVVSSVTALAMLAGCSTQMGRIGMGLRPGRLPPYVVQLDSTGDF